VAIAATSEGNRNDQVQLRETEQPEIERRLVGIQLVSAMREQPIARIPHLLGDEHEARFVRRPRPPQADTGGEHHEGDGEEPEQFAALAVVDHAGRTVADALRIRA
jgi:hypothetical protein